LTVRDRALELLHEVSGLLEQLLGEAEEAEGDTTERGPNVDAEATSSPDPDVACPQGGMHEPIDVGGNIHCGKCNKPLALGGKN